jgi:hypothetical protein
MDDRDELDLCFTPALTFYPLPPEKKWKLAGFVCADERPVNPVARIFMETANNSPSPWGEGRDEGGRGPFEIHKAMQSLTLCQYSGHVSVSENVSA